MHTSPATTTRFQWTLILVILLALLGAPGLYAQSTLGSDPVFELGDGLEPPAPGIADILGSEQPGPDWDDLFNADGTWRDEFDEFGNPGANGVPDFLDTWGIFPTRRDVVFVQDAISADTELDPTALVAEGIGEAIVGFAHDIGNAYAYTAFNGDLDSVLYIGAERLASASGIPSFMLFEFNQVGGAPSIGDIRVRADFDGYLRSIEIAHFEQVGMEDEEPIFDWVAVEAIPVNPEDPAEQCNLGGTACAVCNGITVDGGSWSNFDENGQETTTLAPDTFLEVGLNLSQLVGAGLDLRFDEMQIVTPEDYVNGGFIRANFGEPVTAKSLSLFAKSTGIENGCMADVAGFDLNCTANDVSLAQVTEVTLHDECEFPGDEVSFDATGQVVLTAQARHDIGIFLSRDGGDGLTGTCFIDILPYEPDPPNLDLDNQCDTNKGFCAEDPTVACSSDDDCEGVDICGDIDGAHTPIDFEIVGLTLLCIDTNGDGAIDLPNCMSWRQPGANELCLGPLDAYPGAPSKCNCDVLDVFEIPVPKVVEVQKAIIPDTDDGLFDLQVGDVTEASGVSHGGTTDKVDVSDGVCSLNSGTACTEPVDCKPDWGDCGEFGFCKDNSEISCTDAADCSPDWGVCDPTDRTVGEIAYTGTDLTDYDTDIECVDRVGVCSGSSSIRCVDDNVCIANGAGTCTFSNPVIDSCVDCTELFLEIPIEQTDILCTITNTRRPGYLEVVKALDPIDDTGKFNLLIEQGVDEIDSEPDAGHGGSTGENEVPPGVYQVSETAGTGTGLGDYSSSIECKDNNGAGSVVASGSDAGPLDVTVGSDDDIVCTITNNLQTGTLKVIKEVINDNGGEKTAADFNLHVKQDGTDVTDSPQAGSDTGTVYELLIGDYVVSEDAPPTGYEETGFSGDCDENGNITVLAGQEVTCTITNDDIPPELTLVKVVTNDDGGDNKASEWTLKATNNSVDAISAAGVCDDLVNHPECPTATVAATEVEANLEYTLSETGGPDGYDEGAWSCVIDDGQPAEMATITLTEGQTATCTITNDDIPPELTLVKVVTNDDGGNNKANEWQLSAVGEGGITPAAGACDDAECLQATNGPNDVRANVSYTLGESGGPDGYSAGTWSCVIDDGDPVVGSTITLTEGQTATCTIANDDIPPTLKLVKTVTNDDGGNNVPDDWTLTAAAPSPDDGRNFSNAGGSGVFEEVLANAGYVLSESTVSGYTAGSWSCDGGSLVGSTITLAEGVTGVTCTINNDDIAPQLKLVKVLVNGPGGTATEDDWMLSARKLCAEGDPDPNCGFSDPGGSGTFHDVLANTAYTLFEEGPDNYTASAWSCEGGGTLNGNKITLAVDESAVCTITNRRYGSIRIQKYAGEGAGTFRFDSALLGPLVDDGNIDQYFFLTTPGTDTTVGVDFLYLTPNTYVVEEDALPGNFDFSNVVCVDETGTFLDSTNPQVSINLQWGQDVTCTYRNIERGNYIIEKVFVGGTAEANFDAEVIDEQIESFTLPDPSTNSLTNSTVGANLPPNIYTVTEGLIDGWTLASIVCDDADSTFDLATRQAHIDVDAGEEVTCVFTNVPIMAVTDSALCIFDVDDDDTNGRQWRRIFSQDPQNWPNHKFTATNPGQFYYNVSIGGSPGDPATIALEIPWPFVTQGARPIHVYPSLAIFENDKGETCFKPGGYCSGEELPRPGCLVDADCGIDETCIYDEVALPNEIVLTGCDGAVGCVDYESELIPIPGTIPGKAGYDSNGDPVTVSAEFDIEIPPTGFAYINQHMDDGLKGPHIDVDGDGFVDRYLKGFEDDDALEPTNTEFVLIPDLTDHTFCVSENSTEIGCDTVQNDNEFKRFRGFAGFVVDGGDTPIQDVYLKITGPDGEISVSPQLGVILDGSGFYTDQDGYYTLEWHHKGKAADYTVELRDYVGDAEYELGDGVWLDCVDACVVTVPLGGKYKVSEVNFRIVIP